MTQRENILVAVIIILILYYWYYCVAAPVKTVVVQVPVPPGQARGSAGTAPQTFAGGPEMRALGEQAEYFATCRSSKAELDCLCADGGPYDFAVNEYGTPGADYKDWIAMQAVDPQVVQNHAEFVEDRVRQGANWTGRTYSPDSHESYDPLPWQGLRRPQAVPICNPTQVPDVNPGTYAKDATFTWRSS